MRIMRSIRTFSQLHKTCSRSQNRRINKCSSSSSCCSVLNNHYLSCSGENSIGSCNKRSLPSYTIRNNNPLFSGIQKSLRKNPHHHHYITSTTTTTNTINHSLRHFSASAETETPIDTAYAGHLLLKGLDVHTVPSEMDGHPLSVYTIQQQNEQEDNTSSRTPVLLLHGRTWSSVPVYHLVGEDDLDSINEISNHQEEGEEGNNFSLMEALYNTGHIQPYAMDFRGFGNTPKDEEGYVEPLKCVKDVVSVLKWIHNSNDESEASSSCSPPALLGWSHGALIAQIVAQRYPEHLSKLILYSSIYNPNIKYSIPPPFETPMMQQQRQSQPPAGHTDHDDFPLHEMAAPNEYDLAMADFTNYFDTFKPNTSSCAVQHRQYQPPKSAKLFANAALISDPIKVQWWNLHQLNECHPSQITTSTPTMVVAGDNDPYAPVVLQAELFTNLSRGVDRTWSIIANADHAVHLSEERGRFVQSVGSFVQNK